MSSCCYFWLFFCDIFVKFGIVSDRVCDFAIMFTAFTTDECHQHFSNPGFSSMIGKKGDGWLYIR